MVSAIQSISRRSGTGRFTTSQIQPDPTVLGNLRRLELKIIPKTEHWCGAGATQNVFRKVEFGAGASPQRGMQDL